MNCDELLCLLWHASQWGTGCRCHEDQLLRGETVVCDRKSRRVDKAKPYITILRNNLESIYSRQFQFGQGRRRSYAEGALAEQLPVCIRLSFLSFRVLVSDPVLVCVVDGPGTEQGVLATIFVDP